MALTDYLKLQGILLLLAGAVACSTASLTRSVNPRGPATEARASNDDFARRLADLQKAIAAPTFTSLPEDAQYHELMTAGKLAAALDQPRRAYDYIGRAAAMPQADFYDRLLQVQSAVTLGLKADAVSGMTTIVQRWPERIDDLPPGLLDEILRESSTLRHSVQLPLLKALYDMHWKLKWDIEPSSTWRDLALLLLEQGRVSEAAEVSSRVRDEYVLVAMRADRRFDALVAAQPAQFDISAAAERQLRELESASDSNPHSLALKADVLLELARQQHYAAMLAESDSTSLALQSTNYREKLYEDYHEQYERFLNLRSVALQRAGRWDEAVEELKAASVGNNTNQLLNLAVLYCELGRPNDALEAIGRVRGDTSPYGAMQVEWVRLEAAEQLGDRHQVDASMQFMKKHVADAPWAYLAGLLGANQLDRAAQLLITQLSDPEQRQDALANVQDYARRLETSRDTEVATRWRGIVARKDVQAAIQKVGRIASYRLEEP